MSRSIRLQGKVASGKGDASYWLARFRDAYEVKTGLVLFPGSLNLKIADEFMLTTTELSSRLITMAGTEYGGDRDILMLPCVLESLGNTHALIWRTTKSEAAPEDRRLLELLATVGLRATYGLLDGDEVDVRIEF